jgi:hypothetical protein
MRFAKVVLLGASIVGAVFACNADDNGTTTPIAKPGGDTSSSSSGDGTSSSGASGTLPNPGPVDASATDDGGLSATFKHYDINHVLSTGQSLSVGARGDPPLSTKQPGNNTMFVTGVIAGGTGLTSFAPLVESAVETMSSAFANHIEANASTDFTIAHDILMSVHGVGGFSYAQLAKGQPPYANGIAQAQAGHDLAKAATKTYVVRAVTNVHGETDHNLGTPTYQQNLIQWQSDYETDVKAITGQSEPIPMFHSQISSWTILNNADQSRIPIDQLAVHVATKGKIVLVGPKYQYPYADDGVHLTNVGYRQMGEDYAKVYRQVVLRGKPWEPVRPQTITRNGTKVVIKFFVPVPPLVIDEQIVTNPADDGFELDGDDPQPDITSVDVTAPDTVTITLSAEPTGDNRRLRYAFTGTPGAHGGPTTGPRGNIRDSDKTKSQYGDTPLYNWCVHFDEALP